MSSRALHWSWQLNLLPELKIIVLVLAEQADDDGRCKTTISKIASLSCLSGSQVKKIIHQLHERGIICSSMSIKHFRHIEPWIDIILSLPRSPGSFKEIYRRAA